MTAFFCFFQLKMVIQGAVTVRIVIQFIGQIFESHAAGTIDLPVAVQLAVVARFYERLGDHAVHITERIRYLSPGT